MRAILPTVALSISAITLWGCTTVGNATAAVPGYVTPQDKRGYVLAAVGSDLFEVQSSQLAVSKARRPEVREFARTLIAHHSGMTEKLWGAARASGMVRTHEWMLPPLMQRDLEELQRSSADDFDRIYLSQQVRAHEMALALHRNYASKGDAAPLRQAAAAAAPIVMQHLSRARQLD